MIKQQLIDDFVEKKNNGMGYSEIRNILENKGYDADQVKEIIKEIDREVILSLNVKSANEKAKKIMFLGAVIFIGGLLLTVGTYLGILTKGNTYVISYGPMIGGLVILYSGYSKLIKN